MHAGSDEQPPGSARFATLGQAVRADVGRALAMAVCGCVALFVVEVLAVWWTYPQATSLGVKLYLAGFAATLVLWLGVLLTPLLLVIVVAPRLVRAWLSGDDARAT